MAMDQHPVPQNVTTFQFRLVGDLTLKQVGYLAVGCIGGYILFKSSLPIIFSWPLSLTVFLSGIGFAFVPIENRPMDVWVLSFFKRIYSPTLFSWVPPENDIGYLERTNKLAIFPLFSYPSLLFSKQPGTISFQKPSIIPGSVMKKLPSSPSIFSVVQKIAPSAPQPTLKPSVSPSPPHSPPSSVPVVVSPPPPSPSVPNVTGETLMVNNQIINSTIPVRPIIQQVPVLNPTLNNSNANPSSGQTEFTGVRKSTPSNQSEPTKNIQNNASSDSSKQQAPSRVVTEENRIKEENMKKMIEDLQKQLSQTSNEKDQLLQEKTTLLKRLEQTSVPRGTVAKAGIAPTLASPTIRVVPIDAKKQLPSLTSVPNIVTGVVKDNEGFLLPEIIVTIRDKDDVPLRALKTNKLGQFAASTPLQNNTYFIEIEDPRKRYTFDRIQLTLNGTLVPLIEIQAKSQKQIERQKLSEQIFGKPVQ